MQNAGMTPELWLDMYRMIPLTDHFRRDEHSLGLSACDAVGISEMDR